MSDIFPCGCVFFFLLTGGKHPFGDMNDHGQIHLNILKGEPTNLKGNAGITLIMLLFFPGLVMNEMMMRCNYLIRIEVRSFCGSYFT
jgi:hypothetical protein